MTEQLPSWFEKGRPSLFAALENACRQIDADITAEIQQKAPVEAEPPREQDDSHDWKVEYTKMQARYAALDKNFKLAKERCYKLRDERKELKEKARSLHDLILDAEQEHGIRILGASLKGAEISQDLRAELNAPNASRGGSFASVGTSEDVPEPPAAAMSREMAATREEDDNTNGSKHWQSESTQGESEGRTEEELPAIPNNDAQDIVVKEEPSSDGPVFISERCTNKRKRDESGTETTVARVKTETGQSSPEMSMHRCDFNPYESIDLGEAPPTMWTPRKRRQMELEASQRMMPSVEEAEQAPISGRNGYADVEPPPPLKFASALTPVNVNKRSLPAPANPPSKDNPLRKGLARGIGDLAEDGTVYKKGANQTPSAQPTTKGRLDTLLDSPSVSGDPTPIHRSVRRQADAPTTPQVELGVPKPRALPFDGLSRTTARPTGFQTPQSRPPLADTTNTFPRAKAGAGKGSKTSPKKARGLILRNKPVAELRAEDFKINPQANKGHEYAFSEVVRDKAERAQLPGCIDEHCCGPKFRGLAESEYPDDPTKGEWRQKEQKLLEEYLGDYSHRLTGMPREERRRIWIEARMQQIANKHGKHKHHTSRMRSPPGFWQFDFPSTQEIEAEREEAAKREKQKIQERLREAMRPGGRWLFRDE